MPDSEKWNNGNAEQMGASTEPLAFEDMDTSRDHLCGMGSWRPNWLQRFATHRMYAFAYITIGVVQGMIMAYFGGVLTTMEKVFGIQSSTIGLVLSGNDISLILSGFFINHLGQRGNCGSRPLWIAMGMLTTGGACFLYALPHLLWDSTEYEVGSHFHKEDAAMGDSQFHTDLCLLGRGITSINNNPMQTGVPIELNGNQRTSQSNLTPLILIFLGQLISGIGSTALFSLGFTYMDDSVKKRNSPMYTGMTSALRCFGPVLGFLLASFCLSLNVNPSEKSQYSPTDPLFIGCWWLGFLILGILQVAITFPMILFPKILPSEKQLTSKNEKDSELEVSAWKDFKTSFIRLMKNPVVVAYTVSVGPGVLGMIGSAMFMPKYLEAQFGQTPGDASVFSGISSMAMLMVGTIVGAFVLWKFQPRALYVTAVTSLIDFLHIISIIFLMLLDCGKEDFAGVNLYTDGRFEITSECSSGCLCGKEFNPVCVGMTNYLSPCLAGCQQVDRINSGKFLNCICATSNMSNKFATSLLNSSPNVDEWSTGIRGYCPGGRTECPYLWTYISLKSASILIGSLTRIGSIIVLIRSVEKRDKSIVLALMMAVGSLLGFIPGPIIFGAAVDRTCLYWEVKSDGTHGHCWVYDTQAFSYWFHGLKIICYIISTVTSFFICYYSRNVNLYDDDVDDIKPSETITNGTSRTNVTDSSVTKSDQAQTKF